MSNPSPLRIAPRPANWPTSLKLGATPTRAGNNLISSTDLGHTQQEIRSSLYDRILGNEPGIITHLIKPHLVDSNLVAAIEQALGENAELKAARDLLFENKVPEKEMYMPMVSALVGYCWDPGTEQSDLDRSHCSVISLPSIFSPSAEMILLCWTKHQLRRIQPRPYLICALY